MADPKSIDPPTTSVDERESEKTPLAAGDVAISHFNWAAPTYEDTSGGASRELALRIVELIPKPIHCFAVVLDNACGTGQVAQELLKYMRSEYERDRCNTRIPDGGIFCVDGAERMIDIARTQTQEVIRQLRSHVRSDFINKVHFRVMNGEDLHELRNNSIFYSFTNAGILFFDNPVKGAAELYRKLKSGVNTRAYITTWKRLGYIAVVNEAQRLFDPTLPKFRVPIADEWFTQEKLVDTMEKGGFQDVRSQFMTVHYAFETMGEVVDGLINLLPKLMESLDDEDKVEFRGVLEGVVEKHAKEVERGGKKLVGLEMEAWVGIGRKYKA